MLADPSSVGAAIEPLVAWVGLEVEWAGEDAVLEGCGLPVEIADPVELDMLDALALGADVICGPGAV